MVVLLKAVLLYREWKNYCVNVVSHGKRVFIYIRLIVYSLPACQINNLDVRFTDRVPPWSLELFRFRFIRNRGTIYKLHCDIVFVLIQTRQMVDGKGQNESTYGNVLLGPIVAYCSFINVTKLLTNILS